MRASASCRLTWPRRCCSSLTGQRRRQVDAHCQVAARLLLKLSDGRRELVNVLVRFAELALALVELLLHAIDISSGRLELEFVVVKSKSQREMVSRRV